MMTVGKVSALDRVASWTAIKSNEQHQAKRQVIYSATTNTRLTSLYMFRRTKLRRLAQSTSAHAASSATCSDTEATVAESSDPKAPAGMKVSFSRVSHGSRLGAAALTSGALGFCVLADDIPAVRLGLLTYFLWASGEWVVHK